MKARIVQINSWKSKYPMETLMGTYGFDIICLQEPWAKERESFEHTGYYLITPSCDGVHRVSIYIREAAIPAANIIPRPDISNSPDILVVDLILRTRKISLINLYNDCETRAGVGLIEGVLDRLPPKSDILALMDSNSHHVQWDSKTTTRKIDADFDLHDVLISRPLTLVSPPDIPTHLPSGNVIDLGWASPSLLWSIRDVKVEKEMGLGSDHLPITYVLDLDFDPVASTQYNPKSMDMDKFLKLLGERMGGTVPEISTQEELDAAMQELAEALREAVEGSTRRKRPCSHSKRWWTKELTALVKEVGRAERKFHRYRVPSTRAAWVAARRRFNDALEVAKGQDWADFKQNLERANVYDVLNRMRRRPRSVFPSLVDADTGEAVVEHGDRGRLLARAWFGDAAEEMEGGGRGSTAGVGASRGGKETRDDGGGGEGAKKQEDQKQRNKNQDNQQTENNNTTNDIEDVAKTQKKRRGR